ncbi:hypothetical protein CRG98_010237 [Punica granatum]|uniref:DUF7745 domain-containing protein n=1 Tax=Punica granatum TaxID=22663 RepID=A0A2I0KLK3_PUNGR|nr:hypothetical protein CRG98_010237 [Punica granatum]
MDRPAPDLRLEVITPPRQDIMCIWRTLRPVDHTFIQGIIGDMVMFAEIPVDWIFLRTAAEFWDPEHAVFNFQGTELAPTIEEYTALIQRPTPTTHGIFVPNPFTTVQGQLSTLLHIPAQDIHEELHERWDQGIRIAWLSDWTLLRAMAPTTASYQRDVCHGFILLVFGTLLFPYSPNLIDGAIAQVVLQAVGGHSYVEALLAETVRSLDYRLYFPEHPTDEERVFSATSAYVARFYARGLAPPQRSQAAPTPRATSTLATETESSIQAAMHAELRAIREERDRLRCELVDSRAKVADYRELQTELTRARAQVAHLDREMARLSAELDREVNPPVPVHSQPLLTHAPPPPTPAGVLPAYSGAPSIHLPPPTSSRAPLPQAPLTSFTSDDQARITALEGTVNQMAANMAELLALLRGPNRASSSSTPPSGQGPTVDPAPGIPPTQAPENMDAPAPPTLHASMAQPFTSPYPPPPAPTAVPLPPAAFLTSDQVLSAPPPVSMPAPAAAYTVPLSTVFPTSGMRLPPKFKIPEFKAYGGMTDPRHHLRHYRRQHPILAHRLQRRTSDRSSGHYSRLGNRRRTGGHRVMNNRRRAGSIRKVEESSRRNLQAKNPENSETGTAALFITESSEHRKGPSRSRDKVQTTIRNSTELPDGRFSGSERLPMNLRGTFTENRDHNIPERLKTFGDTEKAPITSP